MLLTCPFHTFSEVNNSMVKIIDELCNNDSKLDRLTDYITKKYIEVTLCLY